jgi:hypothetical protein
MNELENLQTNSAKWEAAFEKERERCRLKSKRQREAKKAAKADITKKVIEPFRMIVTPEQSAKVQTFLFENGYKWKGGEITVSHTDINAISFEYKLITTYDLYPDNESIFYSDTHLPLITFEQFIEKYGK